MSPDIREWATVWSTSKGFVRYAEDGLGLSRQFLTHVRGDAMNAAMDNASKAPVKVLPPSTQVKAKGIKALNDLICKSHPLHSTLSFSVSKLIDSHVSHVCGSSMPW